MAPPLFWAQLSVGLTPDRGRPLPPVLLLETSSRNHESALRGRANPEATRSLAGGEQILEAEKKCCHWHVTWLLLHVPAICPSVFLPFSKADMRRNGSPLGPDLACQLYKRPDNTRINWKPRRLLGQLPGDLEVRETDPLSRSPPPNWSSWSSPRQSRAPNGSRSGIRPLRRLQSFCHRSPINTVYRGLNLRETSRT